MARERVLILCSGNSARSQMAEAWLDRLGAGRYEVESAGSEPSVVHPLAIAAMAEREIDIAKQRSKHLDEFRDTAFDYVITVCDKAAESCPVFPGPDGSPHAERIHWSFPDPAAVEGDHAAKLGSFRAVRDSIQRRISAWLRS